MIKQLVITILFLSSISTLAQNTIKVIDAKTKNPIPKAYVYCGGKELGKTNTDGILEFKTKYKTIEIEADNYENKTHKVEKNFTVSLVESSDKSKKIKTIAIKNESDPRALTILNQVVKKYKTNSPKSLQGYDFKKYSKISIDLDKDSIENYKTFLDRRTDSLSSYANKENNKQNKKEKKDSLMGEDFLNIAKQSNFFLWEKAEQFKYSQKYGEKIVVLDNRISGFKNPIYEFMALGISNLDKIPRQIEPNNRHLYRFFLADTIEMDNRKTIVINFRELNSKQKTKRNKFTGSIFIDQDTYAIKKIESINTKNNKGTVTSIWKLIHGKWFLYEENIKFKIGQQEFNVAKEKENGKTKEIKKKFSNYIFVTNRFFDFNVNPNHNQQDFKGYTYSVQNSTGELLADYRTSPLTDREANTYKGVDSLVQKYDIERKLKVFTSLLKGKIRVGKIDINPEKILSYNNIEKIRLGIGLKTNEKFSRKYSPDVYLGYGFGDDKPKYSLGIDVHLSENKNSIFRIEYINEVEIFGKFSRQLWPYNPFQIDMSNNSFYNNNFYKYHGMGISYQYDLTNTLTARLSTNYQKQKAIGNYRYNGDTENNFTDANVKLTLKYSPKDKNIMTPSGKLTYSTGYPQFFANIEKGFNAFGGNMEYTRADILAIHGFRTALGYSKTHIYGGLSSGNTALWKNYEISGSASINDNIRSKLNLESVLTHYAMPSGTFYADKFVGFQFRHTLPFVFKFNNRYSRIMLGYNAVWGDLKNKNYHNINLQTPRNIYQEAGITWRNFLGTMYSIGFYHRIGYYTSSKTIDNIGVTIGLGL